MRNVLVVDDEEKITNLVDEILTRRGFRVLCADSASAAFAIITHETVHLIISDVHMPGLPGPELLQRLRAGGVNVPVVFISGDLDVETVQRSLDVPRAAFLPKPFTVDELLTVVTANMNWV